MLKAQVADSGYFNFSYYFTTQYDLDIQWVMDYLSPKMTLDVQIETKPFVDMATGRQDYEQAVLLLGHRKCDSNADIWLKNLKKWRKALDDHFVRNQDQ